MSKRDNSPKKHDDNDELHGGEHEHVNHEEEDNDEGNEDDEGMSINTRGQLEDLNRQLQSVISRLEESDRKLANSDKKNRRLTKELKARAHGQSSSMKSMSVAKPGEISSSNKIVSKLKSKVTDNSSQHTSMRQLLKEAQMSGFSVAKKHMNIMKKGNEVQQASLIAILKDFTKSNNVSGKSKQFNRGKALSIAKGSKIAFKAVKSKSGKSPKSKRRRTSYSEVEEEDDDEKEEDEEIDTGVMDDKHDNLKKDPDDDDDDMDGDNLFQGPLTIPVQIGVVTEI